jgi:uncharacterized repeat protein (TIGR03803 family)
MRIRALLLAIAAGIAVAPIAPAHATSEATLYSFCAQSFCAQTNCADGSTPAGIVMDSSGVIYGATASGGTKGTGTIYRLVPTTGGKYKHQVIYNFCMLAACADGVAPNPGIIIDVGGNLYGTTEAGGTGFGTIFELSPNAAHTKWTLQTLVTFCVTSCAGYNPLTGLIYAGKSGGMPYNGTSILYGFGNPTSDQSGMYALTHVRNHWTLKSQTCEPIACPDGGIPNYDFSMDPSGNIYGVSGGGQFGDGQVYELSLSGGIWNTTTVWSFCHAPPCFDGSNPTTGVALDSAGTLYGTTLWGGSRTEGILYKVVRGNPVTQTVLYNFCLLTDCVDGRGAQGNDLLVDGSGNIYGTTPIGGGHDFDPQKMGEGVLFEMIGGTTMHTYYKFCGQPNCSDGAKPSANLLLGPSGTIIGTTLLGGTHGAGTIYKLTP